MRLGNPMVRRMARSAENGQYTVNGNVATYKGVYLKTALYVMLTIVAAVAVEFSMLWAINNGHVGEALAAAGIATSVCFIPLLVIALVIAFVPSTAKVLGCFYALIQGGLLGSLALFVDTLYPGIAFTAFLATGIVFLVALIVNKTTSVRISSNFVRGLMVATISLILIELVSFLFSFTGFFSFTQYIWIQLAVSALCVVWATVMLFWDLQNIDYVVQVGADKSVEWLAAFSLASTLIYMYVEILDLLLRLAVLFGRNRN